MGQITYKINTGTPNFTVHLEPSVSPDQVQTSLGIYSFTGLSAGTYNISIIDDNGCIGFKNNIVVGNPALEMTFDDILYADLLLAETVETISGVTDWNNFFNLPASGASFTSVVVSGNTISLYGGSGITVRDSMFDDPLGYGSHLISFVDNINCIVALGYDVFGNDMNAGCTGLTTVILPNVLSTGNYCFSGCINLTTLRLPSLVTANKGSFSYCSSLTQLLLPHLTFAGNYCFNRCYGITNFSFPSLTATDGYCFRFCSVATSFYLPLCTTLGTSVFDNNVFQGISGNTITLTVPDVLMSCNSGDPDGDIVTLQLNNTVNIIISTPGLELKFDDISYADLLIGGSSSVVTDWNNFFNLPTNGIEFTYVSVSGNTVSLYGGSGITLRDSMFDDINAYGTHLISFMDNANCIIAAISNVFGTDNHGNGCPNLTKVSLPALTDIISSYMFLAATSLTEIHLPSLTTTGSYTFEGCTSLSTISLPLCTSIGDRGFYGCTGLTTISIPACTALGSNVNDNNVFTNVTATTLTVPTALMICNLGSPDGDIQTLQTNNPSINIITV